VPPLRPARRLRMDGTGAESAASGCGVPLIAPF
jgi:hypothetical protein